MLSSTVLCYTIHHYTALYYTVLYNTIHHYTILYNTIHHYTILYNTIHHNTTLYHTVLYNTIYHYTTLYHTIPGIQIARNSTICSHLRSSSACLGLVAVGVAFRTGASHLAGALCNLDYERSVFLV